MVSGSRTEVRCGGPVATTGLVGGYGNNASAGQNQRHPGGQRHRNSVRPPAWCRHRTPVGMDATGTRQEAVSAVRLFNAARHAYGGRPGGGVGTTTGGGGELELAVESPYDPNR